MYSVGVPIECGDRELGELAECVELRWLAFNAARDAARWPSFEFWE